LRDSTAIVAHNFNGYRESKTVRLCNFEHEIP